MLTSQTRIAHVDTPNFANAPPIPVEFVVLHYTACTLEETLAIFCSPERKVCAHFVIDMDGTLYDLGEFWTGPIRQGAHAGNSRFEVDGKLWESFNNFSIGVELVNMNGNWFSFTDEQYQTLDELIARLIGRFPVLADPKRIVGHEHIAGFRGKVDPGRCFDWQRFYTSAYPGQAAPSRLPALSVDALKEFELVHGKVEVAQLSAEKWPRLSLKLENFAVTLLARQS